MCAARKRLTKGPWLYDYGYLDTILAQVRNWGKGVKVTRQVWDRYTLVDPTYPLRYCQVANYKRNNIRPMQPKYFMAFYKGAKNLLPPVELVHNKGDWRVLRDDDLVLAMNRECIKQWEERKGEEKPVEKIENQNI